MTSDTVKAVDLALQYARSGWALLPLIPRDKTPFPKLLPKHRGKPSWRLLGERPASEAEIIDWFNREPECNLGVITGQASGGLVVVDIDRPGAGAPRLAPTPTAYTGRGMHCYYRSERKVCSRSFSWGDVKAEGGYVVLPPSRHPSGRSYAWADCLSPEWVELDTLPLELLDAVESVKDGPDGGGPPEEGVAIKHMFYCYTPDQQGEAKRLDRLACDPTIAIKVAQAAGCEAREIGQAFRCPLPGHDAERGRPSASLYQFPNGVIQMQCFHDREWWPLPDLYAFRATGQMRRFDEERGIRAMWWIRSLVETGVVSLPPLEIPRLPTSARASIHKLYDGFCYALRLGMLYDPLQREIPFSWRFALHWTGTGSNATVSEGMKWLLANGYLVPAEVQGRSERRGAQRFRLGSVDQQVSGDAKS